MSKESIVTNKLNEVLSSVSKFISETQRQDILIYINANEWGLAIEVLCDFLYEDEFPISVKDYDLLKEVGSMLHLESQTWEILEHQIANEDD